jgi:hypothetical protein
VLRRVDRGILFCFYKGGYIVDGVGDLGGSWAIVKGSIVIVDRVGDVEGIDLSGTGLGSHI